MIDVRPFDDPDIFAIEVQAAQRDGMLPADELLRVIVPQGPTWTIRDGNGRILCIAGLIVHNEVYASAWSVLAEAKGAAMIALSRAIRRVLNGASWTRIDMAIETGFAASARWAKMLGFEAAGSMAHVGMSDIDIYVFKREC